MPDPINSRRRDGHRDPGRRRSTGRSTWPRWSTSSWELQGEADKILLKGQSVGNGQTIDFTETGVIAKDGRRATTP
ncbi:MAG: lipocalin family protein [Alistipes shahii]